MTPCNSFYAYIHCKPDRVPFYVGKGKKNRLKDFSGRNAWHKRTTAKYGIENILVGKLECSTESIAYDLERGLIKCLRRSGIVLCNFTDGGDGARGGVPSEVSRKRMSEGHKRSFADPVVKARHLAAVRKPSTKKLMSLAAKIRCAEPANRQRISEGVKKLYADPSYRQHQKQVRNTPEFIANISAKL